MTSRQPTSIDAAGHPIPSLAGHTDNTAGHPSSHDNRGTLTIALAITIPAIVLIMLASLLCYRVRRRKTPFFNRGITPINDEEIESWKADRNSEFNEKSISSRGTGSGNPRHHHQSVSVGSIQKPPSVIVYQNHSQGGSRISTDYPQSPPYNKRSMDVPPTPVLARAPNSRPGLTDESVQGAEAFITNVKRHTSRLAKHPPSSPRHARSRSTRSSYGVATPGRDTWYSHTPDEGSPRQSAETFPKPSSSYPPGHKATRSTPSTPHHDQSDDEIFLGGLSPRPVVHRSEIGRAIG